MHAAHYLQIAGLVVGFAGALLLALAQREGDIEQVFGRTIQEAAMARGRRYIVLAYPCAWTTGLWLLTIGFFLQGAGMIWEKIL